MSILNGSRQGILLAAAAAMAALAGCGGSANDALPLIRATISAKTVSMGGVCETVPVRITPKELRGEANKYANNRMMVTEIEMTGPVDENGAPMCNGTGETLPLAPGDWEFSAPLRSGTYKCVMDIQADGDLTIEFVDGYEGCDGAPPEPEPGYDMMGEGEPAMMGEPEPDGTEPAAE